MSTLILDKNQAGVQLVRVRAKQDTIYIRWIFKLQDPFLQNSVYSALCPVIRELI